jgi:NitT/TauT family transport system permease protein
LILLWTDAGVAPVVVAFLSLFPVLYAGLYAGLCAVDLKLVEMSKVYRVPLGKQIAKLYIPSVLPYAVREGTAGMSFALKLVVSAEVLAGTYKSIGFQMQEAKTYLETATLFALVIVTFLLGLFLEAVGALLAQAVERGRV